MSFLAKINFQLYILWNCIDIFIILYREGGDTSAPVASLGIVDYVDSPSNCYSGSVMAIF